MPGNQLSPRRGNARRPPVCKKQPVPAFTLVATLTLWQVALTHDISVDATACTDLASAGTPIHVAITITPSLIFPQPAPAPNCTSGTGTVAGPGTPGVTYTVLAEYSLGSIQLGSRTAQITVA